MISPNDGYTQDMFDALVANDHVALRQALRFGADPNAPHRPDHPATDLEYMNDPEAVASLGCSPLAFCAFHAQAEAMAILLRAGANANQKSLRGQTPLHLAVSEPDYGVDKPFETRKRMVNLLLAAKADLEAVCEMGHMTPLGQACLNGGIDMVRLLIQKGARVHPVRDEHYRQRVCYPPLYLALHERGQGPEKAIVQALLEAGCDPRVGFVLISAGQETVVDALAYSKRPSTQGYHALLQQQVGRLQAKADAETLEHAARLAPTPKGLSRL